MSDNKTATSTVALNAGVVNEPAKHTEQRAARNAKLKAENDREHAKRRSNYPAELTAAETEFKSGIETFARGEKMQGVGMQIIAHSIMVMERFGKFVPSIGLAKFATLDRTGKGSIVANVAMTLLGERPKRADNKQYDPREATAIAMYNAKRMAKARGLDLAAALSKAGVKTEAFDDKRKQFRVPVKALCGKGQSPRRASDMALLDGSMLYIDGTNADGKAVIQAVSASVKTVLTVAAPKATPRKTDENENNNKGANDTDEARARRAAKIFRVADVVDNPHDFALFVREAVSVASENVAAITSKQREEWQTIMIRIQSMLNAAAKVAKAKAEPPTTPAAAALVKKADEQAKREAASGK